MDESGEVMQPAFPAALPGSSARAATRLNRADLARWLTDKQNPLTARVFVNRIWKLFLGAGLSRKVDDLGAQGEPPVHPELLDWLAVEFVESGWNVRHVIRLMVASQAYRQSSLMRPELQLRDPLNRLVARQSRFRLDAEMIRDNALAVSGLLVRTVGGPSVKPYQPGGLWEAVGYTDSNTANFTQDDGEALYRRSMYTFWKRTSAPPSMVTFDAPSRESCTVRRATTNTPLQALALMNDKQFIEASRHFGQRILAEGGVTDDERLTFAGRHFRYEDVPMELRPLQRPYPPLWYP